MWLSGSMEGGLDLRDTSNPYSQTALVAVVLYLASGPARVVFDFTYVIAPKFKRTSGRRRRRRHNLMPRSAYTTPTMAQARVQRADPHLRVSACTYHARMHAWMDAYPSSFLFLPSFPNHTCAPPNPPRRINTPQAILVDESDDAREHHQALIILSRRILVYVALSTVMNALIYVPLPSSMRPGLLVRLCLFLLLV